MQGFQDIITTRNARTEHESAIPGATLGATAGAQKPARNRWTKPSKNLIEAGGMALIEFHLARRGIESTRTRPGSESGDIWADCPGRKVAIEVKATFNQTGWHVKRSQNGADFYCFVHLEGGRCYILHSTEVQELLKTAPDIFPGIACLKRNALPKDCLEGWARLGLSVLPGLQEIQFKGRKADRVRRYVCKDGTVKEYRYPAKR